MNQVFLKPRLTGKRFDDHTIPLEILKDFSALEEMIVEVAKWKYKQEHPDSKRVQRNFSKGLELHLAQVEDGSAVPAIVLVFSALFAPDNVQYFEAARVEIVQAIYQAQIGQQQVLPPHLLSYFDRFGRGLREGEAIQFQTIDSTKVALTPEIRKRLIRSAQVEEWTEEATLRGRICEVDQAKNSFHLELTDGTKLHALLADQHLDTVLDAFARYRRDKEHAFVLFQGVVKKDRQERLREIESVEHISPLDPLDVTLRLEALAALHDGWLDGKGLAPNQPGLDWLATAFEENFDTSLALPYLYPTAEGGIQAEWSLGTWEISLEIDLATHKAEYQAANIHSDAITELELNLDLNETWQQLNQELRVIEGAQA
ncbi:MAG: hypothetical protein I8H91_08245 [Burkholderiales bacterium]|nr:hypothetical protein [Burkholderiales bacterium]